MGTNNLARLTSFVSQLCTLKLLRVEAVTRVAASNSVSRLMNTSTQQPEVHRHQETSEREIKEGAEENLRSDSRADREEEEDDEFVNKETGEVGGPRGPEPTRYGDWERGGRCSDF